MLALDVTLGILVAVGYFISRWRKKKEKNYVAIASDLDGADDEGIGKWENGAPSPEFEHDEDFKTNPAFQQFIKSISRCVKGDKFGLSFEFDDLCFEPKRGKKILSDVSGTMLNGSFWGVMGGSGAGKSTFVNVLMGKVKNTGGSIKINGCNKDMTKYKKLIGYVPQDDIVHPELTVRENILHSARIRLPSTWRDRDIKRHVDALIDCLALRHVEHSRVGDASKPVISGGQRKRVSIGMELAAAPMAIFLDEPTSGLDATSAASIMRLLKAISRLGVTTIAIIHQPREDIYDELDNLLLLANGRQVYAGPTSDASTYFGSLGFTFPARANPADTIMDIITGSTKAYTSHPHWHDNVVPKLIHEWDSRLESTDSSDTTLVPASTNTASQSASLTPDMLESDRYSIRSNRSRANSTPKRYSGRPASIIGNADQDRALHKTMRARGASWPAQVWYCFVRAVTQQLRNRSGFFFEIGVGALAGGCIGLSAFSANGYLFRGIYNPPFVLLSTAVDYLSTPQLGLLGAVAIGLAASPAGCKVFGEEKLMYWREAASGHNRSAYYVGKLLSTLARLALSALHFTIFLQILATPLMGFGVLYLANLLYFYCIYGLASCVSILVKREDGALLAVMASLLVALMSGVAPPLNKVTTWHLEWLWRMSPGTWFAESYAVQNIVPMGYLYSLDLAQKGIGYTLELSRFKTDML
jgi:ABC-type multidrug transport system ATPase subunit